MEGGIKDPAEKSNHPRALCFTCKGQYLSLQPGSRDKPDKKRRWVCQWLITAINARHFLWRYLELIIIIIPLKSSH